MSSNFLNFLLLATAIFVAEGDVAMTTIKAIDDPRTLNKQLVIHPKTNILGLNELVELFEKKISHNLEKNYIPESMIQAQLDGKN
jgi:hypothetical protein